MAWLTVLKRPVCQLVQGVTMESKNLLRHYLRNQVLREAIVTSDIRTEWITYRQLLMNKPEDSMTCLLKQLVL